MTSDPHTGRPSALAYFLAASALVVAADQITKHLIATRLAPEQVVPVIEGWFQLRFVVNRGGLFGVLRELSDVWRVVLFTGVPAAASAGLLIFLWRSGPGQRFLRWGLALILGGAIGNLIDRLRLGHVIDFLDVFWRDHHWPAFNLADSAICVGVGLILLDAVRSPRAEPLDEARAAGEEPGAGHTG